MLFHSMRSGFGLILLLSLAGCQRLDSEGWSYEWHPTGINAANLAAQVADPRDLRYGHDDGYSPAAPQAVAFKRIMKDRPKKLQRMTNFSVGSGGSGGGNGGGSGNSGGSSSGDSGGSDDSGIGN